MAEWCYDPVASRAAGEMRFKLPYPRADWQDEQVWNAWLLDAMHIARTADMIFQKPGEKWEKAEKNFFKWMMKGIKEKDADRG